MHEQPTARWLTLTVTLTDRADGGLTVHSDDLPGLILSGADRDEVANSIDTGVRALLEFRGFKIAGIHAAEPIAKALRRQSPRDVNVSVEHTSTLHLVVETEAASV